MRFLFFPVAANSRLLSLLETISEALLRETFLWGCVGVTFQANSLLLYWLSKSSGPQFLSRNIAHSRLLSLVSCDQKQISDILDLKAQSFAIKIANPKLKYTADSRFPQRSVFGLRLFTVFINDLFQFIAGTSFYHN